MASTTIRASDAMRDVTLIVNIAGYRRFRVRLWLSLKLIAFACWMAGCRFDVEDGAM